MRRWLSIFALATALAGCSGDNAGTNTGAQASPTLAPGQTQPGTTAPYPPLVDPNPNFEVKEIQIDTVEVAIRESLPPQIAVQVKGTLGDGCSELKDIIHKRDGNTIEISITASHPKDAMCTMIAKLFDQEIKLDGDFPAGEYIVRVNGVEQRFKI